MKPTQKKYPSTIAEHHVTPQLAKKKKKKCFRNRIGQWIRLAKQNSNGIDHHNQLALKIISDNFCTSSSMIEKIDG